MDNARQVIAELCEVSKTALYLAMLGRKAGLNHEPLFTTKSGDPELQNLMLHEHSAEYVQKKPHEDSHRKHKTHI